MVTTIREEGPPTRERFMHWMVYEAPGTFEEEVWHGPIFNGADAEEMARNLKMENPAATVVIYEAKSIAVSATPRLDPLYRWYPPELPTAAAGAVIGEIGDLAEG